MPYAADRAASRHGRDRDLLPARPRTGPYERPYDVRRGYQQPLRTDVASPAVDVVLFRARDQAREDEGRDEG